MKNNTTNTILFIVGCGRSGSTILDLAIGANKECLSVGEITTINAELSEDRWCTCGAKFSECEFWNNLNSYYKNNFIDKETVNKELKMLNLLFPTCCNENKFIRILFNFYILLSNSAKTKESIVQNKNLFQSIFDSSKQRIIVDSSKDIKRSILLYRKIGITCKIIHLVRDVRGVAHSAKKESYTVALPPRYEKKKFPATEIRSVSESVSVWNRQNKRISNLLSFLVKKEDSMLIKYENLIQEPEKTLGNLCNWIGLEYHPDMIHFGKIVHHNIGGNPSRFNSKKILPLPESWRKSLSDKEKKYCIDNATCLMNKFSYY